MDLENGSEHKQTIGDVLRNRYSKRFFAMCLIGLLLVSALGGAVGGAALVLYANKLPLLQKILKSSSIVVSQNQKIVMAEDSAIIDVVKSSSPAVVSIVISKDLNKIPGYGFDPFSTDPFAPFFGFVGNQSQNSNQPNVQEVGAGSGFLVSEDGLILTNKHVVADQQASYTVITNDGKSYEAQVLARDPVNDLAIVKINVQHAPTLTLANSSDLQIGQRVVAIGNSLGQYQNTVTSGIVSGIGRSITAGGQEGSEQLEGVIQTDAAINPGNSGGPLLNTLGQVVGMNTAVDRQGQLVGFAIPSNDAQKALDSFKKTGKISRPFLGVRYVIITKALAQKQNLPKEYGALVVRGQNVTDFAVIPGSPADKTGIVENDIILEVNGTKVDEQHTLSRLLKNSEVGSTITFKVYHKGQEKEVKVTLEASK